MNAACEDSLTTGPALLCPAANVAPRPRRQQGRPAPVDFRAHHGQWLRRTGLAPDETSETKLLALGLADMLPRALDGSPPRIIQFAVDWCALFCVLDDLVEREHLDPLDRAWLCAQCCLCPAQSGGARLGRTPAERALLAAAADLRRRVEDLGPAPWVARFCEVWRETLRAQVHEASQDHYHLSLDFEDYVVTRRRSTGGGELFALAELAAGLPEACWEASSPYANFVRRAHRVMLLEADWITRRKEMRQGSVHNVLAVLGGAWSERCDWVQFEHDLRVAELHGDFGKLSGAEREAARRILRVLAVHLEWGETTSRAGVSAEL